MSAAQKRTLSPKEIEDTTNDNMDEIFQTRRAVSEDLESVLYESFPILDKGFLRVIDYMGNDSAITQSARVSYGKGTKTLSQDKGLIDYLMRHRHTTPFEMCEIKFHVKLPIFVARDWIRHRTANVNEYSGRYSIMSREFYIPARDQLAAQSTTNKQGRDKKLSDEEAKRVMEILEADSQHCYNHYQEMLNEDEEGNTIDESKQGLARELSRINLTLNCYTEWYWKIDLHNLFHFLSLRADSHSQYEIQAYAYKMLELVKKWVPLSYDAFMKYRKNSMHLSEPATKLLKQLISGQKIDPDNKGMGAREWREFLAQLELKEEDVLAS